MQPFDQLLQPTPPHRLLLVPSSAAASQDEKFTILFNQLHLNRIANLCPGPRQEFLLQLAEPRAGGAVPVVGSRLFRRLFLAALADAHAAGRLAFFGEIKGLGRCEAVTAHLAPLKRKNWFVYAKPPFAGPEAVLAYLARYTHRVAISNSRLIVLDERGVTFRYKDYRRNGQARYRTMTLSADEFIRRFLLHVLPKGFHRIRHYGLLASASCQANIARARELIAMPVPPDPRAENDNTD